MKAPDYWFRIGGTPKFLVEAKKPAVNVKGDDLPTYQLRRYAWSAKPPVSIVTNFEEFAVYDCRSEPSKNDNAILGMAGFTIVGGAFLYWHDWQAYGSLGDWVGSRFGLGVTIGALASIVAFLIGLFGTKAGVDRLMALVQQTADAGGGPPPHMAREIQELQARLRVLAMTSLAFIAVAVLAMATARYW
jgi:hypothetical protein